MPLFFVPIFVYAAAIYAYTFWCRIQLKHMVSMARELPGSITRVVDRPRKKLLLYVDVPPYGEHKCAYDLFDVVHYKVGEALTVSCGEIGNKVYMWDTNNPPYDLTTNVGFIPMRAVQIGVALYTIATMIVLAAITILHWH